MELPRLRILIVKYPLLNLERVLPIESSLSLAQVNHSMVYTDLETPFNRGHFPSNTTIFVCEAYAMSRLSQLDSEWLIYMKLSIFKAN